MLLEAFAKHLTLGSLLEELRARLGGYEVVTHWQQGEFHHDTVLRVDTARTGLPGAILVVATNCNGGIKELLCFAVLPTRSALWNRRCPDNPEFSGVLPELLGHTKTVHWFDPCELLLEGARSEYREEFRERQSGGGWRIKTCGVKTQS
jgi:hypothetical protein